MTPREVQEIVSRALFLVMTKEEVASKNQERKSCAFLFFTVGRVCDVLRRRDNKIIFEGSSNYVTNTSLLIHSRDLGLFTPVPIQHLSPTLKPRRTVRNDSRTCVHLIEESTEQERISIQHRTLTTHVHQSDLKKEILGYDITVEWINSKGTLVDTKERRTCCSRRIVFISSPTNQTCRFLSTKNKSLLILERSPFTLLGLKIKARVLTRREM
ncbi:uncharacterized protein LOC107269481 isoform X1 [Cephus cinctus]|uniref:Uncharacterized protein LOC107269481 isoform X1 n=1 Tax=Cephus cinctus TaxID=211228 RepID=A0AAJ7RKB6_CEPCN|nr:uncharacterized protein LOC107269481 isoform X1 [Cephus cinctus]